MKILCVLGAFAGATALLTGAPALKANAAQSFVGPSGRRIEQVKCSQSPNDCYRQATRACHGGSYQVFESESHRGGLFADVLPGPFTWYSMSFACGKSDGRLASFPFRDNRRIPRFVPSPAPAPRASPPSMTTCSRIGNSVTCYSN
jgi:hypothetical protein